MSGPNPEPTFVRGLPHCSQDECALFDGKRCRATGFRPDTLCEPAVLETLEELKTLRAVVAQAEAKADEILRILPARRAPAITIEAPPPDDLLDRITPGCRHTRRDLRPNPHGVPVTTCIDCGEDLSP